MRVVIVPAPTSLPSWSVTSILLPPTHVAVRLADDAPLPKGALEVGPTTQLVVTPEEVEAARRAVTSLLQAKRDWLLEEVATNLDYEAEVRAQKGQPHPYAFYAPPEVTTLDSAVRAMLKARDLWTSPQAVGVIRPCASGGYVVWRGVGSFMAPAGRVETVADAEALALEAVRSARAEAQAALKQILAGWSEATPYYTATISTLDTLPISVRRGPVTARERGSSWDLPVVLEVRDGVITRYDDRVTWDDDASRADATAKYRSGMRQAKDDARRAVEVLCRHPALAALAREDHLAQAEVAVPRGKVRTVGPVRWREDGAVPLALVEEQNKPRPYRYWMALAHFAV